MTRQATMSPLTETRKAHTVYLTEDVWSAIDRSHLELRLREASAPSKIEYIEQVLRAGLESLARSVPQRPHPAQRTIPSPKQPKTPDDRTAHEAGETKDPRPPQRSAPAPALAPSPAPASSPPSPPPASTDRPAPTQRRPTALERLKQASDPGQPAPIRSVADTG